LDFSPDFGHTGRFCTVLSHRIHDESKNLKLKKIFKILFFAFVLFSFLFKKFDDKLNINIV
jgi:hypothetical protein